MKNVFWDNWAAHCVLMGCNGCSWDLAEGAGQVSSDCRCVSAVTSRMTCCQSMQCRSPAGCGSALGPVVAGLPLHPDTVCGFGCWSWRWALDGGAAPGADLRTSNLAVKLNHLRPKLRHVPLPSRLAYWHCSAIWCLPSRVSTVPVPSIWANNKS